MQRQQLKTAMLPIAMIGGAALYKWMGYLEFLSPYLLFLMLLITYCKLDFKHIRPSRHHFILVGVQMILAAICYGVALLCGHTVAEGVFICVFIPTATAAPVITAMLGGSISFVATYSLLSNMLVALAGPVILAMIGDHSDIGIWSSTLIICRKVLPLLLGPLIIARLLKSAVPSVHRYINGHQQLSFYMWAVSLFIIVGTCVSSTINNWRDSELLNFILLVFGALGVCVLQFYVGRKLGGKWGDAVSAGQSLGQKNTVLAVWMALTYMSQIASVAPAAYIAWQNIINSWQLMRHTRNRKE